MLNRLSWTVFTCIALLLSGCVGNMSSVRHQFNVRDGKSQLIDVKQRGIFVGSHVEEKNETTESGGKNVKTTTTTPIICAEPSPDAMSAYAAEMAAKGGPEGKVYGELSAAMQESSSFIGMRTASIQALRDYSYRICEAYMNGAIDNSQYQSLLRRYQKNMVTLFAIEQLSGVNRVPTIALVSQGVVEDGSVIQNLETTEKSLNNEVDILKASKTGKSVDEQAKIDSTITDKNKEIAALDSSIKTLKERGASSNSSIVTIPTTSPLPTNTDKIVDTISQLTNSMLAADELASICISTLEIGSQNPDNPIVKTCTDYLIKLAEYNMEQVKKAGGVIPMGQQPEGKKQ